MAARLQEAKRKVVRRRPRKLQWRRLTSGRQREPTRAERESDENHTVPSGGENGPKLVQTLHNSG
jgi:hypothetical protein